jgi:hypothetical protein
VAATIKQDHFHNQKQAAAPELAITGWTVLEDSQCTKKFEYLAWPTNLQLVKSILFFFKK